MRQPTSPAARPFRVALAQFRPTKADYPANLGRMGEVMRQASALNPPAEMLVFPETAATGYFLEGGVGEMATPAQQFYEDLDAQYRAARPKRGLDVVAGFYELRDGHFHNSAIYCELAPDGSRLVHVHRKFFLPTYGVFDEGRFVSRGNSFGVFETRFGPAAILICEDIWHSISPTIAALKGAQILYVITASPGRGFSGERVANLEKYRQLLVSAAEEHSVFVLNASLVGFEGGKGLIGGSMVVGPMGRVLAEAPTAEEALLVCDCHITDIDLARANSPLLTDLRSALGDVVSEMSALGGPPEVQ
jgi:predicted amidohydrolase